jgi:lysophospholipase L1-like esterase
MRTQPPSLPVILCFGDSLTAGYQSPTFACPTVQETPYGAFLQERVGSAARVLVSGVCGELTGEMAMRFRRDVLARQPTFVVVLGGTNDLGWNAAPPEIMRNLVKMYELASAAGIRPVAVTVPSLRMAATAGETEDLRGWVQQHISRRQALNALIAEYCVRRGVPCVDLFTVTCEPDTYQLAAPYSNDGLHLSTVGYRLLADLLYEQVLASAFGAASLDKRG